MDIQAIKVVIIITSVVLFLIISIFVTLFTLFQRKKVSMLLEQKEKNRAYEDTINQSSIEIRENTLKSIAWELHDNVGQLLSLARLELNILKNVDKKHQQKISEIGDIVGKSLQEIRTLSKTLNPEYISKKGLLEAVKIEIDRFNRLNYIEATLNIKGDPYKINSKDEVVLFRIIQEFFSNTIKHAQATKLCVTLNYLEDMLEIKVKDNGKGFDLNQVKEGSGLINMNSRAETIDAAIDITSNRKGTRIIMNYYNK